MKNKSKKGFIIKGIIITASVLAIVLIAYVVLTLLTPKVDFTEKQDDIFYFPVDFSENIFEDIVYMSKNRDVRFDYYGIAVFINEENYSEQTKEAKFFYDYFKTVINGDAERYKGFFAQSFFARHSIPKSFTMQKIYDIEVSAMTSDIEDSVAYETYKVSYKIYENNGTFRADISSGESKPVAIKVQKGTELKIVSIIPIL